MLKFYQNRQSGVTLTEVIVAMAITSISIVGLMSLQPQSLNLMARADYLGKAAGVLQNELESAEVKVLNPAFSIDLIDQNERTVTSGDTPYTVKTDVELVSTLFYKITATVRWPGNAAGISGCRRVTRQEGFRQLAGS